MSDLAGYLWILVIPALVVWFVRTVMRTSQALHILQLEGYKSVRYLRWLAQHPERLFDARGLVLALCLLIPAGILSFLVPKTPLVLAFLLAWIVTESYLLITRRKYEAKKPLVYTARAKRALSLAILMLVTTLVIAAWLRSQLVLWQWSVTQLHWHVLYLFAVTTVLTQIVAINLTVANLLIFPLERTIHQGYLISAHRRIMELHPKVIAITGSYGKTSTKYILRTILSSKFNALMTPDSYNTPMGICKVIRGQLEQEHEMFIVEMGAYKRGEIKALCRLVSPEIGILTAVGPQHLERFKSVENIARTKYELIESLPPHGVAVFNNDNEICSQLADKTTIRTLRYGIDRLAPEVALTALDIQNTSSGLAFTLQTNAGDTVQTKTKLLGRNNVSNILAAATVALECGMSLEEVGEAIKTLEPIPHRLQLIPSNSGVTVIDDGFNSNPVGAKAALEVLASFEHGRKVLVTPGMVELGNIEFEQNRLFGTQIALVCDVVILVGATRTRAILEGLQEVNFPTESITVVDSLQEATQHLNRLLKPGDVILFENDLPDNYSENLH